MHIPTTGNRTRGPLADTRMLYISRIVIIDLVDVVRSCELASYITFVPAGGIRTHAYE